MRKSAPLKRAAATVERHRAAPLPSRDELIAFISGEAAPHGEQPPARVTKRDIARAFGVKGAAKADLKLLIKDLQNEGAIAGGRKALQAPGRLPTIVVADVTEHGRDGGSSEGPQNGTGTARRRVSSSAARAATGRMRRRHASARAC